MALPLVSDNPLELLGARAILAPAPRAQIAVALLLVGRSNSHV